MDRRRHARRAPAPDEPLSRVRLRTGRDLAVIDLSDSGLLVEGSRLIPGTHVDVHVVVADGRILVRSRVTRAYVSSLRGDLVTYRSALVFDRPIDTRVGGYAIPSLSDGLVGTPGNAYPATAGLPVIARDDRLTA